MLPRRLRASEVPVSTELSRLTARDMLFGRPELSQNVSMTPLPLMGMTPRDLSIKSLKEA